ncbi:hypothetical protein GGH19_002919 [Coemansia sp. RSA 1807]|nr:hypothetical protein GGH19_002919 [Coemansia sp. RSA 1807]
MAQTQAMARQVTCNLEAWRGERGLQAEMQELGWELWRLHTSAQLRGEDAVWMNARRQPRRRPRGA